MAERVTTPPADSPDLHCTSTTCSTSNPPLEPAYQDAAHRSFPSGTYVVQVPKEQIYRVPPPHNARIAELHKNHPPGRKSSRCCKCFLCLFFLALIVLIAIGVIICISVLFAKPKSPAFRVDRLAIRNSTGSCEYELKLDAHNPNSRTGILYKQGGVASLHFRDNEVARGKYPSLHQGKKNTVSILMLLTGSNSPLPKEIRKSLKSGNKKVHVSFRLSIIVPTRMKFGFFSGQNSEIAVICNFTVDTLAKGSRVLSQSCQSTRHRH